MKKTTKIMIGVVIGVVAGNYAIIQFAGGPLFPVVLSVVLGALGAMIAKEV